MESQRLDWYTANSLASDYDLKIQFASHDTITNILRIHRPLPSSVLETVDRGEVMPRVEGGRMQRENKIVCGFGDEVKHLGHQDRSMEPECHFVGYVVAALIAMIALYILAEYMWSRYVHPPADFVACAYNQSRFFAMGSIKLDGEEKTLTAEYTTAITQGSSEEVAAPSLSS